MRRFMRTRHLEAGGFDVVTSEGPAPAAEAAAAFARVTELRGPSVEVDVFLAQSRYLAAEGVPIIGTTPEQIDRAEDREQGRRSGGDAPVK